MLRLIEKPTKPIMPCNYIYSIIYINKFLVPSNFQYHNFILFCNLGFPMSYKTLGSTLIFQFQRVHILLDIILLISYFFHYHLIPNYKVRNPISNKNKRQ